MSHPRQSQHCYIAVQTMLSLSCRASNFCNAFARGGYKRFLPLPELDYPPIYTNADLSAEKFFALCATCCKREKYALACFIARNKVVRSKVITVIFECFYCEAVSILIFLYNMPPVHFFRTPFDMFF